MGVVLHIVWSVLGVSFLGNGNPLGMEWGLGGQKA